MATDEALAYLVALSVPLWLLVEHVAAVLKSRRRYDRSQQQAAQTPGLAASGAPEATRTAA